MSVPYSQMPDDLLMDPDMTLSAVRVWHVIYTETLGRPGWDLSYGQIAERIGSDRRTAMRAVAVLLDKGWLVRIRQKAKAGDDAPNLFSICREPFVSWNTRTSLSPGSATDDTRGGALDVTHRENHLPGEKDMATAAPLPPAMEGQTEEFALLPAEVVAKRVEKAKANSGYAFDEWWAIVPKKVAKGAAERAYRAALKKVSHDTLMQATRDLVGWNALGPRQYIPNPATWLNAERWADEAPPPERTTGVWQPKPNKWSI